MLKTSTTLAAATLIATLPTFTAAESTAISLSASMDDGSVTSVAVAAAFGDFAVASSVANAKGTGAASGATDDAATTPSVGVTYNNDANAYETSVTFGAAEADEIVEDDGELVCGLEGFDDNNDVVCLDVDK